MTKINRNKAEIRHIFEMACAKREALIFVTPYLRLESHFVHVAGNEVHVRVSMGGGDAIYLIRGKGMKLRFPYGLSFLEAPAKILGFGQHEGMRTLTLDLPRELYENDDRKALRTERVGSIIATVSTPKNEIISASLLDLSTTGAKLRARGQMQEALKLGDKIWLTIPIQNVVTVNNSAVVRHMDASAFGVEYAPELEPSILDPLSSWIFRKSEEERDRPDIRENKGNKAETGPEAQKPSSRPDEGRVLVVTSDNEIEGTLREFLSEGMAFFHSEPSVAALKLMLAEKPHLVILHLPANNMEKRRLMKSLAAMVPSNVPILLLGTDIDSGALFELGNEWKTASSIAWAKERGLFVQRLVVGMLRRHSGKGESPMASIDAET